MRLSDSKIRLGGKSVNALYYLDFVHERGCFAAESTTADCETKKTTTYDGSCAAVTTSSPASHSKLQMQINP